MLSEINKIDLITSSGGDFELHLVIEAGEWALADPCRLLVEKANAYAAYALDGQMARQYPHMKSVRVVISAVEQPPVEVAHFLSTLIPLMQKEIPVSVEPLYQAAA
jgi:hypothetical protein